jgi:hypothetical protein
VGAASFFAGLVALDGCELAAFVSLPEGDVPLLQPAMVMVSNTMMKVAVI